MKPGPEIVIATTLRDERGVTGVQTQFSVFRDFLLDAGYPVRVVTPFSYNHGAVYPVFAVRKLLGPLSRTPSLWWYDRWHYRFIRAALRKVFAENANIIVYAQDSLSAGAALESRTANQKIVLAMHNAQSAADEWVSHGAITTASRMYASMQQRERQILSNVDSLVFASRLQRSDMTAIYPDIVDKQSIVMPEFVEVPPTRSHLPSRDAITIGALEPRKNHRFLIAAVGAARTAGHEFTLTIVGDGPERSALETQIQHLGLQDQVHLAGRIPYHEIGYAIEDHRVYLHASRQESFGLAIIEAMAVGRPVVIGRIGGVAELLEDGVEAHFWSDLDHAKHGAELLISLLSDPAALDVVAKHGLDRFKESFAVEVVAPRLIEYLVSG